MHRYSTFTKEFSITVKKKEKKIKKKLIKT
jgi:hypothetical protein